MKENLIHEIIGKIIAGEADKGENEVFQKWLLESKQNQEEFELHKKAWNETKTNFSISGSEAAFKNILEKIDDQHESGATIPYSSRSDSRRRYMVLARIAASFLIIVTFFYLFNYYNSSQSSNLSDVITINKSNLAGQKSKIFLPDGSVVWLNSESKLSYPEKFAEDVREVHIQGEAFFDVIRNENQPFIVRSGNLSTIVLGTTFNVKAFQDEPSMHIALQTGKVKVEIDKGGVNDFVLLEPGEGLKYTMSNHIAVKERFDEEKLLGWKDGKLVFKDADLDEIVSTLSRWYGVDFTILNREKTSWSYTGSFENAILDNVLHSMSFTKDFTYTIQQKNVTLKLN